MAVYKGSGSVTSVTFSFSESLINHKLKSTKIDRTIDNCQVHQIGMYTIEIKVAYTDIADCNCCKYEGYWYRIVDYTQSSTNYGTVTCEFSPLLSFLYCNKANMWGTAQSTISVNPYLLTSISSYPTVEQIGRVKLDRINLASSDNTAVNPMALYVALSLPATMVNADATASTLSDWTSYAPKNATSPSYYQNTGVIILKADFSSEGGTPAPDNHSLVDALTIMASDPLYVGCIVDVWIDGTLGDSMTGVQISFSSSSAYGLQGFADSFSMYAVRRKPVVHSKVSIPIGDYADMRLYNGCLDISFGGENTTILLSELDKQLPASFNVYDGHLMVIQYPALSSQGGEFAVVYQTSDSRDDTGRVIKLHSSNIPVIGLQAGINAGAAYWQQNKSRYELGQTLNIAETLYGAIVGAFSGAGKSLEAMSAGFVKILTNKLTKDAIIADNSRISTGASGVGHMWVNPYWSVILSATPYTSLVNYLKTNPLTINSLWTIDKNDLQSPIRLIEGNTSLPTWIQGVFDIPSLPHGCKKQRVLSMLQQGLSINYNVGLGYQEG